MKSTKDAFVFFALGIIVTFVGYILFTILTPNFADIDLRNMEYYFEMLNYATSTMMIFTLGGGLIGLYGLYILVSMYFERTK